MSYKHVCVLGLGYVGLPTAAILASRGVNVTGVDISKKTVDTVNGGRAHIVEPDLDILVNGAVARSMLKARTEPIAADAFILAVPTPFDQNHLPDLSYLQAATMSIAPVIKKGDLVIVESTVPVGSTDQVARWLADARPDLTFPDPMDGAEPHDICIAHSPERVLPGRVILELVRNDRVVGGLGDDCAGRTAELYALAVEGEMHLTSARTAELVKLSENAFRDVNIAFANELANVSDHLGIDVREVIRLANRHPRVAILKPGPGVGGHCIAVDPWFIVASAPELTPLIKAARHVNDGRPEALAMRTAALPEIAGGGPVACLGLSYKADIDDLRESPSIEFVRRLRGMMNNPILVVEPYVAELPAALSGLNGVSLTGIDDALAKAAVVVLLTDHKAFTQLPPEAFAGRTVIDSRGALKLS